VYDTIEWASKQPWCNGSVAMAGNSWLAIAQVNFASRYSHPALKALAPWEAATDPYRDLLGRGGIPHAHFFRMIYQGLAGMYRLRRNLDPELSDFFQGRVA
jgi:putative CocE/NonD family hydrolase